MAFRHIGVVSVGAWAAGAAALLAATFADLAGDGASAARPMMRNIRMIGMIEDGDANRLRALLTELRRNTARAPAKPLAVVEMNSIGGDIIEAMKLGYMFQEFGVATVVRSGDSCLSACALAFLGGAERQSALETTPARTVEVGGSLGFHNFYLNPNHERSYDAATPREGIARGFNDAKGAASRLVRYSASLGVDANFIARMLGRPPEAWDYAETAGTFIDLKICPTRLTRSLPPPAERAVNVCVNTLGEAARAEAPEARLMSPAEARRYLLWQVRQDVASSNARGALVAELAAMARARDDAVSATYTELRAAGAPLPEILGPTYEVKGLGAGVFDLTCVVSLSADDPDRFDAVLRGPAGFIKPARPGPPSCSRLLSFDRGDVLNPPRR